MVSRHSIFTKQAGVVPACHSASIEYLYFACTSKRCQAVLSYSLPKITNHSNSVQSGLLQIIIHLKFSRGRDLI